MNIEQRLRIHGQADDLNTLAEDKKRLRHSEREAIEAVQQVCMDAAKELETLRADAERYRWLRDIGDETWEPMAKRVPEGGKGIDAAIDAAILKMHNYSSAPPRATADR